MRDQIPPLVRIALGLISFIAGVVLLTSGGDVIQGVLGVLLGFFLFFGGLTDRDRQRRG